MFTLSGRTLSFPGEFGCLKVNVKKYMGICSKWLLSISILLTGLSDIAYSMAPPQGGAEGQPQGPMAMVSSFLPLILIFGIFYFLLIRPQSKKAKEHKQMLETLKKGDKVMTSGGLHGIIEDIDGDTITLKIGIGSDLKVKASRGHIAALRGKE